ncbi:MAG: FKBP-type peptidyl-prolyl cis-trans isomerase FkpA [Crocinitomix sp.]|jgi:FKBP-type peptidyl-prolyl cis-trans isomerase FkpA
MKYVFSLLILSIFLMSCAKKKAEKQAAEDATIIQQYVADNSLMAIATSSGLYYVRNVVGAGASCSAFSTVTVAYKGYFTDGTVFDESPAEGITFSLSAVIQGWTEGIPYFKEGGNGVLVVPSALAYGPKGRGSIPGNSVLVFDVHLIEVVE